MTVFIASGPFFPLNARSNGSGARIAPGSAQSRSAPLFLHGCCCNRLNANQAAVHELFEKVHAIAGDRLWFGHFRGCGSLRPNVSGARRLTARSRSVRERIHRRLGIHGDRDGDRNGNDVPALRTLCKKSLSGCQMKRFTVLCGVPGCRTEGGHKRNLTKWMHESCYKQSNR